MGLPLNHHKLKERLFPYILIFPAILTIFLIIVYPMVKGIYTSFHYHVLTRPDRGIQFIGLQNYVTIIKDPVFWKSLQNTFWWVCGSVGFQFLLGLASALLLNQSVRCRGLFRGLILIPWIIPGVVAGLTWAWLFNGTNGVFNDLLFKFNLIAEYIPWLGQTSTAMFAVTLTNIWKGFPFFALMLLAGLQTIPKELYESAAIDGATIFQQFKAVTLPMLRHIIIISITLRIIWTTNNVDLIFTMTKGGPGDVTNVLSIYSFMTAWSKLDFGYGTALGVTLLLILMVFAISYIRLTMRQEDEG